MADNTTLPGTGDVIASDDVNGVKYQRVNINDLSFIERIALKALTKLTFSLNGLRVDASGATVAVTITSGTVTAVTTVGTVNAANLVALGQFTAAGMSIALTQQNFQNGFRRNMV